MKESTLQDTRIKEYSNTSSPEWLWELLPLSEKARDMVMNTRKAIEDIILGKDKRKILVIGSCSVHNIKETEEYTRQVIDIAEKVKDRLLVIERVNLEKPRTLADWPGIMEDPDMDGSCDIETGRYISRQLLLNINEMGIPCATEYVNTSTPQYIGDLIAWSWVGARTTESQMHKRMASGLSTSVGFKNSPQGSVDSAINAVITASAPNKFPGIKPNGMEATIHSIGNPYGIIVLRGGDKPNYSSDDIKAVQDKLKAKGVKPVVVVDCSHGNSSKDYRKQPDVFRDVITQMQTNEGLVGVMLESYINEGNQKVLPDKELQYGVSITDSCINLPVTLELIEYAFNELGGSK